LAHALLKKSRTTLFPKKYWELHAWGTKKRGKKVGNSKGKCGKPKKEVQNPKGLGDTLRSYRLKKSFQLGEWDLFPKRL